MSYPVLRSAVDNLPYWIRDPENTLSFNAISSIVLNAYAPHAEPRQCTFPRGEGVPNAPLISKNPRINCPVPPRWGTALPPPGDLTLALTIEEKIGSGRSGVVFGAKIDLDRSSPEIATLAVPPLVVKISRRNQHTALIHEAFYYDEMEGLQGVIVPRCYGLFMGRLPDGAAFFPPGERLDDRRWLESEGDPDSDDSESDDSTNCEGREPKVKSVHEEKLSHLDSDPELKQRYLAIKQDSSLVSILVLERLGGTIPVGEPLHKMTTPLVLEMYQHLSYLGIDHNDLRHANILLAPHDPPGWPSLISPLTQNVYNWRIIDFETALKADWTFHIFDDYYSSWLEILLDNLPHGAIFDPEPL